MTAGPISRTTTARITESKRTIRRRRRRCLTGPEARAEDKWPRICDTSSNMATAPDFTTAGNEKEKIDVRLSYRIVRLFSEGLYASSNKAIEELVANSFDAGALQVAVFLPADFHEQSASIAVLDDGEGMDASGLKQHWLIGK